MLSRSICLAIVLAFAFGAAGGALAQQSDRPRATPGAASAQQPELDDSEKISPSQVRQPPPRAAARPVARAAPAGTTAAPGDAGSSPATGRRAGRAATARTVSCDGAFSKGSSHLQLAMVFGSENITFTQVAGPEGSRLMASVVYPKNPKQRVEVLWHNEASRVGTNLVVLNEQTTWSGPRGIRLGMPLAGLEKANGKPFRLTGFDKDGSASVVDWNGGAFEKLPGGCNLGVRLVLEAKTQQAARAAVANANQYDSKDAAMRAVSAKIAEIIFGYPQ
ncbi:MAG: hypothetical protein HY056_16975 [Proteobacteria bacterium]|nr:hypothetical protein [Pseudomonadota bacterium]